MYLYLWLSRSQLEQFTDVNKDKTEYKNYLVVMQEFVAFFTGDLLEIAQLRCTGDLTSPGDNLDLVISEDNKLTPGILTH